MRLVEIVDVLSRSLSSLHVRSRQVPESNQYTIENLPEVLAAVRAVGESGLFKPEVQAIANLQLDAVTGEVTLGKPVYSRLVGHIEAIRAAAEVISSRFVGYLEEVSGNTVAFRLPESSHLADTSKHLRQLNSVIEQAINNDTIGGNARLEGFDRGSLWVYLLLSPLGMKLLAGLVEIYYKIRQRELDLKASMVQIKHLEADVETIDRLQQSLADKIVALEMSDLEQLLDNCEVTPDDAQKTELRARIKNAAYPQLVELLRLGMEVHPALPKAPPEPLLNLPSSKQIREMRLLIGGDTAIDTRRVDLPPRDGEVSPDA